MSLAIKNIASCGKRDTKERKGLNKKTASFTIDRDFDGRVIDNKSNRSTTTNCCLCK